LEEKWEPSQHLRLGPRKTKKTWVEMAGRRNFRIIYIYIYMCVCVLFIKSLLHVSAHNAPSSGRTLVFCSKLSAYCNVALVTKRKIYYVWVLQRYLQLLEQYIIPFIVGWFAGMRVKTEQ